MADRVYIHIGAPKSGTTFLQTLLWANQENLAASGVLLPGTKKFDHNHIATFARSDRPPAAVLKTWRRLEAQIREWAGPVVLSNEWFTLASPTQIQRLVDVLSPAEVHVIFTARNLVNTVPAAWQETLKLGFTIGLDDFVKDLDEPGTNPRWWWGTLDPAVVLADWTTAVPADRIQIVTVPPKSAGPDALWNRFAAACNIDPAMCSTNGASANESVGAESARLLQLIGPELREAVNADDGPWTVPYRWIRSFLSHSILAPLGGSRIGLRDADVSAIRSRSDHSVAAIKRAGFGVKGDLEELRFGGLDGAVHPDDVPESDVLGTALKVVPPLLHRAKVESSKLQKARQRIGELEEEIRRLNGRNISSGPTGPVRKQTLLTSPRSKVRHFTAWLRRSDHRRE